MINYKCPRCGEQMSSPDSLAGQNEACPRCGNIVVVPPPVGTVPAEHGTALPAGTRRRKHRLWLALLVVAALVAAPFAPKLSLWFGIILLMLCPLAFIPGVQGSSRRILRINPSEKWRSALRLTMYGVIGLALIIASFTSDEYKAKQERTAAKQAEEEAEQRRLPREANIEVVAAVRQAELAWRNGNSASAEAELDRAGKITNATELAPIHRLRTRMANASVEALVAEATKSLKAGDIEAANEKVQAALAVRHADNSGEARKLDHHIGNAIDPTRIRVVLMDLPDAAFQQLQERGEMPEQLVSGYEELDSRMIDSVKAQVEPVSAARKQRKKEQLEREQAAAEARRKAKEERIANALAAAEVRRREARQQRIENGFSVWDGSHRGLTKVIKSLMNDPDSYKHVKTTYWDRGDHLVVRTTFRGKNVFGGVVVNCWTAKVDLDGNVLAIIEQGP